MKQLPDGILLPYFQLCFIAFYAPRRTLIRRRLSVMAGILISKRGSELMTRGKYQSDLTDWYYPVRDLCYMDVNMKT